MKVFLGGTCNNSTWRDILTKNLKCEYFNPIVDDWTEECQEEEIRQRETCDYVLYCITPKMTGVYSIAEVVDDSNKRPNTTLFCFLSRDGDKTFDLGQIKSLTAVAQMIEGNGATVFGDLDAVAKFLNARK